MAIRSTGSLLWSCAPDAPALSRCHLAVHKPTRIDWLCWNGIVVVVVVVVVVAAAGGGGGVVVVVVVVAVAVATGNSE